MKNEYVRVREAAEMLGMSIHTVRRLVDAGRLPRTRRTGGFTSPIMVHLEDLHAMMREGNNMAIVGKLIGGRAGAGMLHDELNARCMKLAQILGSADAIIKVIREVGGAESGKLSDVDLDRFGKLRCALIKLANPMFGGQNGPAGKFVKQPKANAAQIARELVAEARV
jgi:excisionase family DNA binding protein